MSNEAFLVALMKDIDGELELTGIGVFSESNPTLEGHVVCAPIDSVRGDNFADACQKLQTFVRLNYAWLDRYITWSRDKPVFLGKSRARNALKHAVLEARSQLGDASVRDIIGEVLG